MGDVTFIPSGGYTLNGAGSQGEPNVVCPANAQSFLMGLVRAGRMLAVSQGFAECMQTAIEVGLSTGYGPYVWQINETVTPVRQDPCWGATAPCTPPLPFITQQSLDDAMSPNDFAFVCDHLTTELGYAAFESKRNGDPENVAWSLSNLNELIAGFPNVGQITASNTDFFGITAGGMWHEAMHQLAWTHYPSTDPMDRRLQSVPYIMAECMHQVGVNLSQGCTDNCPGDLRPVAHYADGTCECTADPQPLFEVFKRVYGRTPSRSELGVALDRLSQGTSLGELEASMRRVQIDRATTSITIDGAATETAWTGATVRSVGNPLVKTFGDPVFPNDSAGTWRATFDDTGLYVFVDVVDDERTQNNPAQDWHLDDSVEIYVDADGSRATSYGTNDFQFGFRPLPDQTVHFGYHSASTSVAIQSARTDHTADAGYSVEVLIPWTALGVAAGRSVAMEVHINDDDGLDRESQLSWATNSPDAWENPSYLTPVNLSQPIGIASTPTEVMYIDGLDTEQNWAVSEQVIQRTAAPRPLANGTGSWRAFWSEDYLFVFVEAADATQVYLDGPQPWEDDSVEIYLDTNNHHHGAYDGNDFQFVFRRDDAQNTVYVGGSSAKNTAGVLHETRNVTGGYNLEVAIPWGTMGLTPATGLLVGFDVHVNDDDNGGGRDGKVTWHSTSDESWRDTGTFGVLELTGDPGLPQVEIHYATQTPLIDGNGNDAIWPVSQPINKVLFGTTEATAGWSALWDYNNLYLRLGAGESSAPVANSGLSWWDDDSVELFLDPGFRHARTYDGQSEFQYLFRPGSQAFIGNTPAQGTTPFVRATSGSVGYTIEVMIPWAQLGTHVMVGSEIGFDVHVNDDDTPTGASRDAKLAWALPAYAGDSSWSLPQLFGRVKLVR